MRRARNIYLALLLAFLVACSQQGAQQYFDNAEQLIKRGQLDAAVIELKNAVSLEPNNPAGRLQLGDLYLRLGRFDVAEKELRKGLDAGASKDDVYPKLIQTYYFSEQFDEAIALIEESELSNPEALRVVTLFKYLSSVRSESGVDAEALDSIANKLDSESLLIAKAYHAFSNKRDEDALTFLSQLPNDKKNQLTVEYLYALITYRQEEYADSVSYIQQYLDRVDVVTSVDFFLVDALTKNKQFELARKELKKLASINREHPLVNYQLANVAYQQEEYKTALTAAEKAIQNGLDNSFARMIAGVSAYRIEAMEKAYLHLRNLSQREAFNNDYVNRLLAKVQLTLGYDSEALDSLHALVDLNAADADLFSMAGVELVQSGNSEAGRELLSKATSLDSQNLAVKLRLAAAYLDSREEEEKAVDILESLLNEDTTLNIAWVQLASAKMKQGDKDEALKVARRWQEVEPDSGKALEGLILLKSGEFDNAIAALEDVVRHNSNHVGALTYLIQAYYAKGDQNKRFDTAAKLFEISGDSSFAVLSLVDAAEKTGRSGEAERLFSSEKTVMSQVGMAMLKRQQGNANDALAILNKQSPLPAIGKLVQGDILLERGNADGALDVYMEWAEESPSMVTPLTRMAAAYEIKNDYRNALSSIDKAGTIEEDNISLKLLKIHYLIKLRELGEAEQHISQLKQDSRVSQLTMLSYYEGQLALSQENYEKAEDILSNLHRESPTYATASMLAKAMVANGKTEEAGEILGSLISIDTLTPLNYLEIVASFFSYQGNYAKAAKLYELALEQKPEAPELLNNFAYNRLMSGTDLEKAKNAAKQAVSNMPQRVEFMDTLAWIEFKQGNIEQALEIFEDVVTRKPDSNAIMLHYAEVLIAAGRIYEARMYLNKVVKPNEQEAEQKKRLLSLL